MKLPRIRLPKKLTQAVGKMLLKTKAARPEICMVGGFVLGGAALVLVGVETWKGKDKLSEDAHNVKCYTKKAYEEYFEQNPEMPKYSEEDRKKFYREYAVIFAKDIAKTYWKPATLAIGSTALIFGGNRLLRKELSIATTALVTLKQNYDTLVAKMRKELGDEKTQELLYGTKVADVFDAETGKSLGKTAIIDDAAMISPYAFRFDDGKWDEEKGRYTYRNPVWNSSKVVNIATIVSLQNSFNDLLKINGFVFENEVRREFGMKLLERGWKYGWVLGSDGDGFIDFGVLPGPNQIPVNKLFMDEKNPFNTPIIDLNVDGKISYIYEDMDEYDNRSNVAFAKRRNGLLEG